jgi:hypothetical protein
LRAVTGLDCPFCGANRATFRLLRGDIVGALDLNALFVLALPVLAFLTLRKRPIPWPVLAVLLVGFGVLRNVPALSILGT